MRCRDQVTSEKGWGQSIQIFVANDCSKNPQGVDRTASKLGYHSLEGFWRSLQVPITDVMEEKASLQKLEEWMRSHQPEKLFEEDGKIRLDLQELAPTGTRRTSAKPMTDGGVL